MEITSLLIIAALFFGFFAVAILCSEGMSFFEEEKRKQKALRHTTSRSFFAQMLCRGVPGLIPISKAFLNTKSGRETGKRVQHFIENTPRLVKCQAQAEALISIALLYLIVCLVVSLAASGSVLLGVCVFGLSIAAISMTYRRRKDARSEEIRESIPEALQIMKTCFFAGYSLPQTFEQLVKETKAPLKTLFQKALSVLTTGGTLDEALNTIKKSSHESELIFLAAALEIQHKTGSSIEHVLDAARQSVSDELELKRSLKTQTAQAKLSAQIVTLMPFVLIILFSLISDGFLSAFFESPLGLLLLTVALVMQVAGVLLVRKLLRVEVA